MKSSSPRSTSVEERAVVGGLGQLDRDVRPCLRERPQEPWENARADALERADAERARRALGERGQVGLGGLEARDDSRRVAEEELARLGQGDAPGAAGPLDEPLADHALERLDLLADRRLRVAEPFRGTAERALFGHGLESRQMPQFDPEPSIRSHDRNES